MKKILLLGGTGVIGQYVAQSCLKLGYEVTITSRSSRRTFQVGLKYLDGNALDFDWLRVQISNYRFDAIVDFMVYRTKDFRDRISFILDNTTQYIFLSSYRVFSDTGIEPINERSPLLLDTCDDGNYLRTDEYALSKARQEYILRGCAKNNWTIVRPSITYGAGRFQLGNLEANLLLPRAKQGLPVVLPKEMMPLYTTMTWAGDVGRVIASLLFCGRALNDDFNVTASESYTWRDVSALYANIIGLVVREVSLVDYERLGLSPFQLKYDRLVNRVCNNDKSLSVTGIQASSFMSLEDGLQYELNQLNIMSSSSFTRIHGCMDRILGISRLWPAIKQLKFGYLIGFNRFTNKLYTSRQAAKVAPRL